MLRVVSLAALIFQFPFSVFAQETDPAWESAPRAAAPTVEIQWRLALTDETKTGKWRTGPAEILRGQRISLRVPRVEGASIRWMQIIPDTTKFYKNANHPWEEDAYKWVGFAKIPCARRELISFRDIWEIQLPRAADEADNVLECSDAGDFYHAEMGSFWLQAEVLENGKISRSAGLEENTNKGMSPAVFRLSLRSDDEYIGWLTSFFNVPGLFGCVPYQSSNYIGVDCADCLAAAHARWKGKALEKDWNVAMIVDQWKKVAQFNLADGNPDADVAWTKDVRPGDFIAVKYPGRNTYQHIGALYSDTNKNGKLDAADQTIHTGPEALQISTLAQGSFDGHVAIIRPE